MAPAIRPIVVRYVTLNGSRLGRHSLCPTLLAREISKQQAQWASTSTRSRPTLSFLSSPVSARAAPVRTYASERTRKWLRHEFKLFVRYAALSWVGALCVFVIIYFVNEEKLERAFPTPHEWTWVQRKYLRDAHKWTDPDYKPVVNWAKSFELARNLCLIFEDVEKEGNKIPRLTDHENPDDEVSWEFIPHDVSGMSEEWTRGYFETMMLAAKGAEFLDGWMRDVNRKCVCAPEYVIGPSNPRPKPIPPGAPSAPREEDCELAFPPADRFYMKILATKGFSARQKMEAAFEYANFIQWKQRSQGADALYNLALAEATMGMDSSKLPYDTKTFVLKDGVPPPSLNILDAITAIANYKARSGDVSAALPIYISLLKTRRSLPDEPPRGYYQQLARSKKNEPWSRKVFNFFLPPDYPPPPPDGTQAPWRSPEERCHEASLNLYIGEILYATNSRDEGLAWTRDGVDIAEEQLRVLPQNPAATTRAVQGVRQTCRECLKTGLDNWSVMVAKLAKEENLRRDKSASTASSFSFWSTKEAAPAGEGRWDAEGSVVKEKIRRTQELVEDIRPPNEGILKWFKA